MKKDISNADSYLEEIKNGLKEYHVPEINKIYVMNVKDNYYNYIVIDTAVNKEMIFDEESRLYFIDFE